MERAGDRTLGGTSMKKAIVVEPDDIKEMLAEKYGVSEKNIIKSQYSYTVILDEETQT